MRDRSAAYDDSALLQNANPGVQGAAMCLVLVQLRKCMPADQNNTSENKPLRQADI